MSEKDKNSERQQPISDEELDEASGGFLIGISATQLPHTSMEKPTASKLPYSGKKPKATLL